MRVSVSDKSAAHRFAGTTQSLCYYCGSIGNRRGRRLGFCWHADRFWSGPSKFLLNVCPWQQNEAPTTRIPCSEASKEKVKAGMKEKKNADLRASVNLVGYTTVWEKWGPSKKLKSRAFLLQFEVPKRSKHAIYFRTRSHLLKYASTCKSNLQHFTQTQRKKNTSRDCMAPSSEGRIKRSCWETKSSTKLDTGSTNVRRKRLSSPVLDLSLSLDTVCPMRSYCSRLDDSCGTSTDDRGPFFHVYTISLMG